MATFDDFISNPDPIISGAAARAKAYKQQLDSGQISQSEYTELCQNALDLQQIDTSACTVEELAMLQKALDALMAIAGIATSL